MRTGPVRQCQNSTQKFSRLFLLSFFVPTRPRFPSYVFFLLLLLCVSSAPFAASNDNTPRSIYKITEKNEIWENGEERGND